MAWDDLTRIVDLENNESDQGVKSKKRKALKLYLVKRGMLAAECFFRQTLLLRRHVAVNPLKGHR
jgi:hypothetical protein